MNFAPGVCAFVAAGRVICLEVFALEGALALKKFSLAALPLKPHRLYQRSSKHQEEQILSLMTVTSRIDLTMSSRWRRQGVTWNLCLPMVGATISKRICGTMASRCRPVQLPT